MQNSNLSTTIFPIIKNDWSLFIKKVEKELQQMITTCTNDKRRIKDLERLINKIKEIINLSKDNIEEVLNYKDLFMYIDNSLESSFDALKFFKEQDNLDNDAVRSIYERIIASPEIMKMNSEYSRLTIKIQFDNERVKRLGELIRGSKVDFNLIKELVNKYKLSDNVKKNVLFYPVVMLSIKQSEIKNSKENIENKKREKQEFYYRNFKELTQKFLDEKERVKELLVKCFNVREKMDPREVDMYSSFANNPSEIMEYDFDDEIKFKIYTLSFFKIKKDIENYLDGISDLILDGKDLDDELSFFSEMINEFVNIANTLNSLIKVQEENENEVNNKVYFALDAFNRVIIDELLTDKNMNSIKTLLQKVDEVSNSKFEGVKTNHMLGVENEEKLLGKNISMLTTSKLRLAYIMINKSVLILGGTDSNEKFDRIVRLAINKNLFAIRNQIALIEKEDVDYIELQNKIISSILGEERKTR